MTPTLQSLQALGVRELSVKNQQATAVNLYPQTSQSIWARLRHNEIAAIPPLPTSGIPDGTVLIEQVEEQEQYRKEPYQRA